MGLSIAMLTKFGMFLIILNSVQLQWCQVCNFVLGKLSGPIIGGFFQVYPYSGLD